MKTIKLIMILITIWCFFFGTLASVRAGSSQTVNDLGDQMNQVNRAVENGFTQLNAGPDSYRLLRRSISDEFSQPGTIPRSYKFLQRSAKPFIQVAVAGQAVSCHCFCGINIPAPCTDQDCINQCPHQEPSQYQASNDQALLLLAVGISLVAVVGLIAGLQGQAIFGAYPKFSMTQHNGAGFKF